MPRRKKTETVAEVKAEAVTEAINETAAEVSAPADKPAKKTPTKKKAASAKAKAETVNEAAEKPAKKTTAKAKTAAAPKEVVKLQFGSDEYDLAKIKKAVEADYKGKFNGRVKSVEIYVKPEDKAAYYVVNSDFSDKIEL